MRVPPLRLALSIAISLVLIYFAFRNVHLDALITALLQINPFFLGVTTALYFVDLWLRTRRWSILVRGLGPISDGQLYIGMIVGYAANNLLPARVGEIAASSRWASFPARIAPRCSAR